MFRRRGRSARLRGGRRARDGPDFHPPIGGRAVRLWHGARRSDRHARGGGGAASSTMPGFARRGSWRSVCRTQAVEELRAARACAPTSCAASRACTCATKAPTRPWGWSCPCKVAPVEAAGAMRKDFEHDYRRRFAFLDAESSAGDRVGVGGMSSPPARRRRAAAPQRKPAARLASPSRRRDGAHVLPRG